MTIWVLGLLSGLARCPRPAPTDAHHRITRSAAVAIARQAVAGGRIERVVDDGRRFVVLVCRRQQRLQVAVQVSGAAYAVRRQSGDCEPGPFPAPHDLHSDAKRTAKRAIG